MGIERQEAPTRKKLVDREPEAAAGAERTSRPRTATLPSLAESHHPPVIAPAANGRIQRTPLMAAALGPSVAEKTTRVARSTGVVQRNEDEEGARAPVARRSTDLESVADKPIEQMSYGELSDIRRLVKHAGLQITRTETLRMKARLARLEALKPLNRFRNDALVSTEFVTAEHKRAIGIYCKKNNVVLSVRDTGSHSLLRVAEGAKPKPHTILEKSIKESSLKAGGHTEAATALASGAELVPDIGGVSLNDLKGFVGHWHPKTKELLGVRVDGKDVLTESSTARSGDEEHFAGLRIVQGFLAEDGGKSPYIPLDRFAAFRAALPDNRWKQYLYTGDYDLHEVYKAKKTLAEGTTEKARVLTGINKTIAAEQSKGQQRGGEQLPLREGTIKAHQATARTGFVKEDKEAGIKGEPGREVPASTLHAEPGSQYAMIQHGDQMGYITNQIHEGRLKDETGSLKAQMVGVVAQESPSALAWCVNGDWFVTKNLEEHQEFRDLVSVTRSSGWSQKFQDDMASGQLRTMEVMKSGKKPTARGTKEGPSPGSLAEAYATRSKRSVTAK